MMWKQVIFFFRLFSKKCLLFLKSYGSISKLSDAAHFRVWRSLVSRLNGVQEALSSNLNTRTKTCISKEVQVFSFVRSAGENIKPRIPFGIRGLSFRKQGGQLLDHGNAHGGHGFDGTQSDADAGESFLHSGSFPGCRDVLHHYIP